MTLMSEKITHWIKTKCVECFWFRDDFHCSCPDEHFPGNTPRSFDTYPTPAEFCLNMDSQYGGSYFQSHSEVIDLIARLKAEERMVML